MTQASAPLPRRTSPVSTAELRELIAGVDTVADLKKLKDETPFQDAGADSLDVFNLIVAVEDTYGIIVPSDHLRNL